MSGESKYVLVVYVAKAVRITNVSRFMTIAAQLATHDEEAASSAVIRTWPVVPSSDEMRPRLKADLQNFTRRDRRDKYHDVEVSPVILKTTRANRRHSTATARR
jgi:hypothetical protein